MIESKNCERRTTPPRTPSLPPPTPPPTPPTPSTTPNGNGAKLRPPSKRQSGRCGVSERRAIADMVERSIRTREENMDLRARIRELEKIIHERDLDIVELAEDRNEWIVAGAAESRRAAEAERKLADRDARMFKLEAFVEEVRKVLDYEDWHPSEWHRFLRHSIPSAAAEGGGA